MANSKSAVFTFIRKLKNTFIPPDATNFYAAKRTNLQRHNLQTYLA